MNVAPLAPANSVYELPTGRALFSDSEGRVLRATWHLDRGLVNLSVWHDDRCTETFRLSLGDAAQFVAFLVGGLSDATTRLLQAVAAPPPTGGRRPACRVDSPCQLGASPARRLDRPARRRLVT